MIAISLSMRFQSGRDTPGCCADLGAYITMIEKRHVTGGPEAGA